LGGCNAGGEEEEVLHIKVFVISSCRGSEVVVGLPQRPKGTHIQDWGQTIKRSGGRLIFLP